MECAEMSTALSYIWNNAPIPSTDGLHFYMKGSFCRAKVYCGQGCNVGWRPQAYAFLQLLFYFLCFIFHLIICLYSRFKHLFWTAQIFAFYTSLCIIFTCFADAELLNSRMILFNPCQTLNMTRSVVLSHWINVKQ